MPARASSSWVTGLPASPRKRRPLDLEGASEMGVADLAVVLGLHRPALIGLDPAARFDPGCAQWWKSARHVDGNTASVYGPDVS